MELAIAKECFTVRRLAHDLYLVHVKNTPACQELAKMLMSVVT